MEVPGHASWFIRVMLVNSYLMALAASLDRIIIATGKVRTLNLINLFLQFNSVVLAYLFLLIGIDIDSVILLLILPSVFFTITALLLIQKYVNESMREFVKVVYFKNTFLFLVVIIIPAFLHIFINKPIVRFLLVIFTSILVTAVVVYSFGINQDLRRKLLNKVRNIKIL